MNKIFVNEKTIGTGEKIFIIGEIASAHDGQLELMKKMIEVGAKTGVDAIKVQIFEAEELVTPNHPKYDAFHEIELEKKEWEELFNYGKELTIDLIADVFDTESANLAEKLGAVAFKIHSTNLTNPYLLENVAKKGKPIFLATGGSTLEEIEYAVNKLKESGNEQIVLMHGYQGNPAKIENTNLKFIQTLEERFNLNVGIADHVDAEDEMAMKIPLAAVLFGACVVEKHYTLDRSKKGRDYYSALNPDELEELVKMLREVQGKSIEEVIPNEELREKIIGDGEAKLSEEELEYRKIMKKSIVAREDIEEGELITLEKLAFKRAMGGLSPSETENLVGKKTKQNIRKNQVLSFELVE